MKKHAPKVSYLKNYKPTSFLIDSAFLHFDLQEEGTTVKAILSFSRNFEAKENQQSLVLNGEEMELLQILLNGIPLTSDQYEIEKHHLKIFQVPDVFTLETEVKIMPQKNIRLSGLYKSGDIYCTQCESHGFRRITYFLDRPDVLTRFTTTISADKERYPVLLSNGNLVDSQTLTNGRHWVKWEDPTLKPCYLFALVAGDLEALEDTFITQSERVIKLSVYVEPGKTDQALHAMHSLKEAMGWDEKKYGREYDLDRYMIVGVSDFNFGAMENKGLNIFNDKYILAKPETATDDDFVHIQGVIGHEYFHNWSGNRVTVRDWFQITLKEGLTVFRDQQFTADTTSSTVNRIQQAKTIRTVQFVQDAGPMAHPIYPDSYIEVNNFYTVTVYEKGAEVIRMLNTLLGQVGFRTAMDLYFTRNDGHAVTVQEFLKAMEDASGLDLTQFRLWYTQAGTPELIIKDEYDARNQTYSLTVNQFCPPTPGQPYKAPFHIPLAMGLIGKDGIDLPLQLADEEAPLNTSRILNITRETETFRFINVPSKPVPSLLRNFSAPVKLQYEYSEDQFIFLMAHDSDTFNRWDAVQQIAMKILLRLIKCYQEKTTLFTPYDFLNALSKVFDNEALDEAFIAEIFTLPSELYLIEHMEVADVTAIHHAREWLKKCIAIALKRQLLDYYNQYKDIEVYSLAPKQIGRRRLKNLSLAYLGVLGDSDIHQLSLHQFHHSNNMTDTMGALASLINVDCKERREALSGFYHQWRHDSLVVDKWFSLQAQSSLSNTLQVVKLLTQDPVFDIKNPNRVRSLIGAFCSGNPLRFHEANGEGYEFLADNVLKINAFNPQLAARILDPLIHWKKFDAHRQLLMQEQLQRIANDPALSNDVYEIVSKSLA